MSKKIVSLVLCALMLCACLPGLAEDGISVTDMLGREISLSGPADRVVVLMPADAEILWALGAADTVVGVGTYCVTPEESAVMPGIEQLPVVDSGYVTNLEEIVLLQPQVVILTKMGHSEDLVNALASCGIQVVVTDAQDLNGVYDDILLIGKIMGKDDEAKALVSDMQQQLADIAAQAGETGLTVYVEESPLEWGLWTAGSGTYIDDLAAICGLTNIFADLEGHQPVSEEQVLIENPDVIITMSMYYGVGDLPDAEIMGRTGWNSITAVKNGAVLYDPTNAVALPGPRLVDVAQMLLELVTAPAAEEEPAA